jgi:sec-independent protein translocase protein TatB
MTARRIAVDPERFTRYVVAVFGMSLGEIMVLLIVGIVVVGPKNLPSMMRTAGQWVTKLRRMSTDLRSQSGIDDLIRHEGLEKEIAELRSLARMNVVDTLITPAFGAVPAAGARDRAPYNGGGSVASEVTRALEFHPVAPLREREYPLAGCDAHGALADDASTYHAHDYDPDHAAAIVAAEAPSGITTNAEGHVVDQYGHVLDAHGHVINADGHVLDAEGHVIDAEGHVLHSASERVETEPRTPASNVAPAEDAAPADAAVASSEPAPAQESAAS